MWVISLFLVFIDTFFITLIYFIEFLIQTDVLNFIFLKLSLRLPFYFRVWFYDIHDI